MTAGTVLDALAARHDEGGWNGRPGRWVFLREVPAMTGSYEQTQRFDALAIGLVPSNGYARIVYEVKVARSDWLRELKPKPILRYDGRLQASSGILAVRTDEELAALGYTIEEQAKWAAAMAVATEFWYAAPVRTILPSELPAGAGLLEIRPWGRDGGFRARVARAADKLTNEQPGPEFWSSVLRHLAGRQRAR